ncbi:hypothetical protein GEMRC1_006972 [Eukaryota sp. GEM-RC1]
MNHGRLSTTFASAPFAFSPSGDPSSSVKTVSICQRTRLALNLFDTHITSFHSKIRSIKSIPFWKPVLRSVEGRYIYTSSHPPNGPVTYIELSLLPSHLTPPLLRSTSSNPSAAFFLVIHPFGISNPFPLSDSGSLKRALTQIDSSLQSLYFGSLAATQVQRPGINIATPTTVNLTPGLPPGLPSPLPPVYPPFFLLDHSLLLM